MADFLLKVLAFVLKCLFALGLIEGVWVFMKFCFYFIFSFTKKSRSTGTSEDLPWWALWEIFYNDHDSGL